MLVFILKSGRMAVSFLIYLDPSKNTSVPAIPAMVKIKKIKFVSAFRKEDIRGMANMLKINVLRTTSSISTKISFADVFLGTPESSKSEARLKKDHIFPGTNLFISENSQL